MRPRLPRADDVIPYLRRMDAARMYSNFGPLSVEVEERYAERFGVPAERVVTCSNATVGLQGALEGMPVRRVHLPSWTFAATAMAVVNAGLEPEFHDVDVADWQMVGPEPVGGEAALPVLPFGAEIDLRRWSGWEHCVIDAAASGGAVARDLSALPEGWAVALSLHATKVLGVGEGGVMIFGSEAAADRFRSFTQIGFVDRRESDLRGTNAKMSEPTAAYALAALDGWPVEEGEWRAARALVAAAKVPSAGANPSEGYPGVNPYWLVRFQDASTLARAEAALVAAGIESRRWWPRPCHRMGALIRPSLTLPVSDSLAQTVLGLPFSRDLSAADVARVADVLHPLLEDS